jgi:serine protease Do
MGLSLGVLDNGARGRYKIGAKVRGVVVTAVDPGSPAGDKNMRPGDVIVQVQGAAVKTPADVGKAIDAAAKSKKPVALFLVSRGGDVTYVGLRLN